MSLDHLPTILLRQVTDSESSLTPFVGSGPRDVE
jgi:hypothetical protein